MHVILLIRFTRFVVRPKAIRLIIMARKTIVEWTIVQCNRECANKLYKRDHASESDRGDNQVRNCFDITT